MNANEKHAITYRSILEEIDRLEKRKIEIDKNISEYRDSIDLVGKNSELGVALRKEISVLSGERNQIPTHITELKSKASMFEQMVENISEFVKPELELEETKIEVEEENIILEEVTNDEVSEEDISNEEIIQEEIKEEEITEEIVESNSNEIEKTNIDTSNISRGVSAEVASFLNVINKQNQNVEEEIKKEVTTKNDKKMNIPNFILNNNNTETVKEEKENIKIPDFIKNNNTETESIEEVKEDKKINIPDFILKKNDTETVKEEALEEDIEDKKINIPDFILKKNDTNENDEKLLSELEDDIENYIDKPVCLIATNVDDDRIIKKVNIEDESLIPIQAFKLFQKYGNNVSISIGYDCYKDDKFIYNNSNVKNIKEIKLYSDALDGLIAMEEFENEQNGIFKEEKEEVNEVVKEEKSVKINIPDFILNNNNNTNKEVEPKKETSVETSNKEEKNTKKTISDKKIQNIIISCKKNSKYYYQANYDVLEDGELVHQTKNTKESLTRSFLLSNRARRLVAKKYGISKFDPLYKNLDLSVIDRLERIDKQYNTNCTREYVEGKLDIEINYDLDSIFKDSELSISNKFKQLKIAFFQKTLAKTNYNCPKGFKHLKKAAATAMIISMLPLGISGFNKVKNLYTDMRTILFASNEIASTELNNTESFIEKNTTEIVTTEKEINNNINTTTEKVSENKSKETIRNYYNIGDGTKYSSLDSLITPEKATEEENNKTTEVTTEKVTTEEKTTEATTEKEYENNITKEENEVSIDTNINNSSYHKLGLNDKIILSQKDNDGNVISTQELSGDSWGRGNKFSASKLKCDYFKIRYISVHTDDFYIDPIRVKDGDDVDAIVNSLYEKFGADINISFNFDGYVNDKEDPIYKVVGWLDSDKIVSITNEDKEVIASNKHNELNKKLILHK